LIYKTVEDLEVAINKYFDDCDNKKVERYIAKEHRVAMVNDPEPYTMSGLAYSMGIDRRTLLNYTHREKYFPTIKKARDKVHSDVERRLMGNNATGAIFNLKNNFDWKDKTEVEQSGEIKINDTRGLSDKELDERITRTIQEIKPEGKGKSARTPHRKDAKARK